ncbi:MAG: macro domain-containing protein [Planctomycetota bacterium]|nr:macro domain-containing protein [Planctomycetota bacterium]
MRVIVLSGDILDQEVDALVCSANPHLRMSGGVNGAILLRGGQAVQQELDAHLAKLGRRWVETGAVVVTGPGPLRVRHILHAVAIDGHYRSSAEVVAKTIGEAFRRAAELRLPVLALAALATGYGRLPLAEFARGLVEAVRSAPNAITEVRVVLRHEHEAKEVRDLIAREGASSEPPLTA